MQRTVFRVATLVAAFGLASGCTVEPEPGAFTPDYAALEAELESDVVLAMDVDPELELADETEWMDADEADELFLQGDEEDPETQNQTEDELELLARLEQYPPHEPVPPPAPEPSDPAQEECGGPKQRPCE